MKRMLATLSALILIALPSTAPGQSDTDCFHNGKAYPEGTRVGETVCEDGRWVEK